ncbi:MAG: V-type ATP synthase subunit I, partial [Treponema sp.]|nr:V-type ATP synthase subunit I [Treponema sp.]
MIRPRKMKCIELTVYKNDINAVLEYLGKNEAVHFYDLGTDTDKPEIARIERIIDRLRSCAEYIGLKPGGEPEMRDIPCEDDETLTEKMLRIFEEMKERELSVEQEKQKVSETLKEAKVFSKLNAPYVDLAHLSYLTLRVGRLDPASHAALRETLKDRAVVIPLDSGGRFLAASSRKGRFALDSELKKFSYEPIAIPEGYKGIPSDILNSLEGQFARLTAELEKIKSDKDAMLREDGPELKRLESSWLSSLAIEKLKARFTATANTYLLAGWTPDDMVAKISDDLSALSGGRVAIRTYRPEEIPGVRDGSEKVPVAL